MKKDITDTLLGRSGSMNEILIIIALISAAFTTMGFGVVAEANGGGVQEYSQATLMGIASWCILFIFWKSVFLTLTSWKSPAKKAIGFTIIIIGAPVIIALSSWPNVTAMGGKSAMNVVMLNLISKSEKSSSEIFKQTLIPMQILPDLEIEENRLRSAAASEFKSGTYTGSPGGGAVYKALVQVADRISELKLIIVSEVKKRNALRARADSIIVDMRKIVDSKKSIKERMRMLAGHSNRLGATLSQMEIKGLGSSIERIMSSLSRETEIPTRFSSNKKTAESQKLALLKLKSDIDQSVLLLSGLIQSIANLPVVSIPTLEPTTPMQAVAIHYQQFLFVWISGFALDFGLLFPILFILLAKAGKTDGELRQEEILDVTLRDKLNARAADEQEKRLGLSSEFIKRNNERYFGSQEG